MSLPLPDQVLPPPPLSNAQTTAPFQQMLSAVVGKASGRNSIGLCVSTGIAKLQALQSQKRRWHHLWLRLQAKQNISKISVKQIQEKGNYIVYPKWQTNSQTSNKLWQTTIQRYIQYPTYFIARLSHCNYFLNLFYIKPKTGPNRDVYTQSTTSAAPE